MKATPYQTLRDELVTWISSSTGINHLDVSTNDGAKTGYFTVLSVKGESIGKSREVEYYKIFFYKFKDKLAPNYTSSYDSVCEIRAKVFNAIADNYESSLASIIDFDYIGYEFDYEKGILELTYSFDFERQYYLEDEII
jgi:hypothetical protein